MPERVRVVKKRARFARLLRRMDPQREARAMQSWNDPKDTLPLASFAKPERRDPPNERRLDERRATLGERRISLARTIRALLQF